MDQNRREDLWSFPIFAWEQKVASTDGQGLRLQVVNLASFKLDRLVAAAGTVSVTGNGFV